MPKNHPFVKWQVFGIGYFVDKVGANMKLQRRRNCNLWEKERKRCKNAGELFYLWQRKEISEFFLVKLYNQKCKRMNKKCKLIKWKSGIMMFVSRYSLFKNEKALVETAWGKGLWPVRWMLNAKFLKKGGCEHARY